jgi:hypothetical protein
LPRQHRPFRHPVDYIACESNSVLQIGSSNLSVEHCLSRIRAGDQWHNNLTRLTGHWIARGWSDAEILTAAEALTLPGYTAAQTRREVASMIAGGRQKWAVQNPDHDVEAHSTAPGVRSHGVDG